MKIIIHPSCLSRSSYFSVVGKTVALTVYEIRRLPDMQNFIEIGWTLVKEFGKLCTCVFEYLELVWIRMI